MAYTRGQSTIWEEKDELHTHFVLSCIWLRLCIALMTKHWWLHPSKRPCYVGKWSLLYHRNQAQDVCTGHTQMSCPHLCKDLILFQKLQPRPWVTALPSMRCPPVTKMTSVSRRIYLGLSLTHQKRKINIYTYTHTLNVVIWKLGLSGEWDSKFQKGSKSGILCLKGPRDTAINTPPWGP